MKEPDTHQKHNTRTDKHELPSCKVQASYRRHTHGFVMVIGVGFLLFFSLKPVPLTFFVIPHPRRLVFYVHFLLGELLIKHVLRKIKRFSGI